MKVFNITINDISQLNLENKLSLALGYFDGVHKGHKKVINTCVEIAHKRNLTSALMTLEPHPLKVIKPEINIECLTNLDQRIKLIKELGIEILFILRFDKETAKLCPDDFINNIINPLNVKEITAGFDYRFGKDGIGDMKLLSELGEDRFNVTTIDKVASEDVKISSTLIRRLICEGKVDIVQNYLEKKYSIIGTVIHGEKRGRTIGYPTANILPSANYVLPKNGVYIVEITIGSIVYKGVCNVGLRPTFHNKQLAPNIEVHIFDFDQDIYDELVEVIWHKKIRNEKKFNSIDELIVQLNKDSELARQYFNDNNY